VVATYSTANVPSDQRAKFVQAVADDCYGSFFHWQPRDSDAFTLNMAVRHFGDIMLVRHRSSDFNQVNPGHAPHRLKRRYVLHAAVAGTQTVVFDGRPLTLDAGDFALLDTSRRCLREQIGAAETIAFAIPERALRRHVLNVDALVGQRLTSRDALCSAATAMLRSISDLDDMRGSGHVGGRMVLALLDLLDILAERGAPPDGSESGRRTARVAEARRYVDAHLADPDLSVTTIAAAMGVSTRYLRIVFAEQNASLPDYIRGRRLAMCRAQLLSPHSTHRSITEIAFASGFNDLSHFCRVFRDAYGVSARDCRRR
jgi:AraC-like DNA-binding protein